MLWGQGSGQGRSTLLLGTQQDEVLPGCAIDMDTLARDYSQANQHYMDYHLTFLFKETLPSNLSLVRELYANMKTEVRSQVVTVQGIEVNITPGAITGIIGTLHVSSSPYTEPSYSTTIPAICHTLVGMNSTAKWIRPGYKNYHHSFPFSHRNKEARVLAKIVTHSFF